MDRARVIMSVARVFIEVVGAIMRTERETVGGAGG